MEVLSPSDRPLQFVPSFEEWCGETEATMRAGLLRLQSLGIGGIVLTVSLTDYLVNAHAWEVLRRGVVLAHDMGFKVWLYDEKGYPSGTAGGLVLKRTPSGEAEGLVRTVNPDGSVKYDVIRLFEGTHATANFYEQRRYINVLDSAAVTTFLDVTHAQYARVLDPLANYVEAFFTDEPSLISAYVPRDRTYPPTLPWHATLPEFFRKQKGYDLAPHLESLFRDTGPIDRKIRCDFYEVVAELCAENYFGRLQKWCKVHHVQSSGHLLGEETLYWQTVFDADPFPAYRRFDIPGIDMILSDPERILTDHFFIVPEVAASAARLNNKRRVMCEISDFFGDMEGHPASINQMCCTAGILYALGVTDLVCMYPVPLRPYGVEQQTAPATTPPFSDEEYRVYTDCVTRLRTRFLKGKRAAAVAVVHPLRTIWAHFVPSHRSMYEPHPDAVVQSVDEAFLTLCRTLLTHGIEYDIVDERGVASARIEQGKLQIGQQAYSAVVLPPMDTANIRTMEVLDRFSEAGGIVLAHSLLPAHASESSRDDSRIARLSGKITTRNPVVPSSTDAAKQLESRLVITGTLTPEAPQVLRTRLLADASTTYFLVNVSSQSYEGIGQFAATGKVTILDPVTGTSSDAPEEAMGGGAVSVHLSLKPYGSMFITFQ
jgi:hypothetical protein